MSDEWDFEVVDPVQTGRFYPLPSRAKPWTVKLFELALARGGRIRYEEAVQKTMPLVPPGVAFRVAELSRQRVNLKHSGVAGPRKRGDLDSAIRSGQRSKIIDSLNMLKRFGRIKFETDENGVKWIVVNIDWRPRTGQR